MLGCSCCTEKGNSRNQFFKKGTPGSIPSLGVAGVASTAATAYKGKKSFAREAVHQSLEHPSPEND